MMIPPLELSDRDHDALTMHLDAAGVWVTCTSGDKESTIGPVAGEVLSAWLVSGQVDV